MTTWASRSKKSSSTTVLWNRSKWLSQVPRTSLSRCRGNSCSMNTKSTRQRPSSSPLQNTLKLSLSIQIPSSQIKWNLMSLKAPIRHNNSINYHKNQWWISYSVTRCWPHRKLQLKQRRISRCRVLECGHSQLWEKPLSQVNKIDVCLISKIKSEVAARIKKSSICLLQQKPRRKFQHQGSHRSPPIFVHRRTKQAKKWQSQQWPASSRT